MGIEKIQELYPPHWFLDLLGVKVYEIDGFFIDLWTIPHFFSGIFLAFFIKDFRIVLLILALFEVVENLFLYPRGLTTYEPILNIGFDILMGFIGWAIFAWKKEASYPK